MKLRCVKQHDATDCAAASIATVCLYYGKDITITKLRDIAGTDIRGTTVKGLIDAAGLLGFNVKAVRIDRQGFTSRYTLPAIAHVITNEGLTHFVVVFKIGKKKLKYSDPAKGIMKSTIDEFFELFDGVMVLLAPTNDFKPEKKHNSMFSKFIKLLLPQKRLFISAIVASVILTLFGIASSFFNKILVDEILPYNLKNQLTVFAIAFIIISVVQILLSATRQQILLYLSQKIDVPLLLGYFKHVFALPTKFFATRKTGDILTRFSDASTIKNVFTNISLSLIIDIVMAVGSGVILYFMNATLFIVVIILTLISAVLVFIFKKPYKSINLRSMEQGAALNSQIIESLRGIETVKSLASEEDSLEKIEHKYIGSLRIAFEQGVLSNVQGSVSSVISSVGNIVLMWIGAMMVMNGKTTLGSLMAFSTLAGYFMSPIGRLINLQLSLQEANIAMRRLSEILDVEEEQPEGTTKHKPQSLSGDIVFENVTFRYGSRSPILKDISMTIPKGKKIALVGESGSGKTTLSKLVMGLWQCESGRISVNGFDVEEVDLRSLREKIAYVPQNVELFSESIADNVRYGSRTASYEEVRSACKAAGCGEFIERLPARYDTFLQEAGANLSGGERQRIAIARALIKNPDILLLDEATSNLDFMSEAAIYDTLFNKMQGVTMLIVAHRLSTIRKCDIIYVLDKGKVAESGTHEELLNKKGTYYKLWVSQVGVDEPVGDLVAATDTQSSGEPKAEKIEHISDEVTYD
jgi:ABC-type bacteriocin transporter